MLRGRKKINWTGGAENHIPAKKLHPYVQEVPAADYVPEPGELLPGALWTTTRPLRYERPHGYDPHVCLYVSSSTYSYEPADFPAGVVAVYMGTLRVDELNRVGTHVRPERHSFLIGGTRYITASLSDFFPVR